MKWYTFVLALLLAVTVTLGGGGFALTQNVAHAQDACTDNGKLYIPSLTFGPFYNGHSYYYAYLSGYQCGTTTSSGGQYGVGVQYYEAHTDSSLSTGTGVDSTEAYGAAYETCNGSPYGIKAHSGGWFAGDSADTGVFSFSLANCSTGHDYFLKAYHYQKVHSTDSPEGETKCSGDTYIYSSCAA